MLRIVHNIHNQNIKIKKNKLKPTTDSFKSAYYHLTKQRKPYQYTKSLFNSIFETNTRLKCIWVVIMWLADFNCTIWSDLKLQLYYMVKHKNCQLHLSIIQFTFLCYNVKIGKNCNLSENSNH